MEDWPEEIEFPENSLYLDIFNFLNENFDDVLLADDLQSEDHDTNVMQTLKEEQTQTSNKRTKRIVNITNLLVLSQRQAAKVLGVASSTLNKRWRETTSNRTWPNKIIAKIDSEIELLKLNCPKDEQGNLLDPNIEQQIQILQARRKEEMSPVILEL